MTRRGLVRVIALVAVIGAGVAAYAVGNGDIRADPEVTIITITSTTGTGNSSATLENTTSSTTYNVLVGSDPSCDPAITFDIAGGNPTQIPAGSTRSVQLTCPARGVPAMRRCLYHATNNANGTAVADFMNVCLYGSTPGTLTPAQTTVDFGTVPVGASSMLQVSLQHDGPADQMITRIYLQTTDIDGNFQFSTPCNPDATYCDQDIAPVGQGSSVTLQVKCTPQTAGTHSAQLLVGTNTYQLLAQPVTLTCTGSASATPVLSVNPTTIGIASPVDVGNGSANVVVHLINAGGGTLLVNDVRTVDVDTGAAMDWSYTASGECTGPISSPCSLEAGEQLDLNLTFDPAVVGRRRATLLISYKDTLDRTKEIGLDATGLGATLELVGGTTGLPFGQVPLGRSSTLEFDVVNRGNRDATAQLTMSPNSTPPFTVMPASSAVIAPHVNKTISVTCAPTTSGAFTSTITAQAMDAVTTTPISLTATCEGSSLAPYANPTSLVLGELRVGAGVAKRTVQVLSATAPAQLTLTGQPQLESANSLVTLGAYSQLTTPATFDVTITPQTDGQLSNTIIVTTSDGETLRIPLHAKIVTADYEVASEVDLGTFCVNQPTTSSNVSLASVGTATIALMAPQLGAAQSPFQMTFTTPSMYPTTIVPGVTATVSVTPQRQTTVATLADTLTWRTDVEGKPTGTTKLSATFIDQGGAIAPPALDFGKVKVHLFTETGQRVMIQNCNPTPLVLDPPMVKTPFSIDSPNFPAMLNPNETTTFSVGFHPTRIGVVSDTLRITSPQLFGTPLEVMLVGEGITDPEMADAGVEGGKGNDDTSFYACSCRSGHPGGLVPLILAIMCVVFPRRLRVCTGRRHR